MTTALSVTNHSKTTDNARIFSGTLLQLIPTHLFSITACTIVYM